MISILLAALVSCQGVNDTAEIQAAVNTGHVQLVGDCRVNGNTPVMIPADRDVEMEGATVSILPGCARVSPPCTLFQTAPGTAGSVRLLGGTLVGSLDPAVGFQIAVRFDSTVPAAGQRYSGQIIGTRFERWRDDAIYVGGNTPSRGVRISDVTVDTFGRNGLSFTHADDVYVDHVTCRNAVLIEGRTKITPGACIDVEANPGERVTSFYANDVTSYDVQVGIYAHKHPNATLQGWNYHVANSHFFNSREYGVVINSAVRVVLANNVIDGAGKAGVSIGAFTEATRATDVHLVANWVRGARGILLAGARDVYVMANELNGGLAEPIGLGVRGEYEVEPPPTGACP